MAFDYSIERSRRIKERLGPSRLEKWLPSVVGKHSNEVLRLLSEYSNPDNEIDAGTAYIHVHRLRRHRDVYQIPVNRLSPLPKRESLTSLKAKNVSYPSSRWRSNERYMKIIERIGPEAIEEYIRYQPYVVRGQIESRRSFANLPFKVSGDIVSAIANLRAVNIYKSEKKFGLLNDVIANDDLYDFESVKNIEIPDDPNDIALWLRQHNKHVRYGSAERAVSEAEASGAIEHAIRDIRRGPDEETDFLKRKAELAWQQKTDRFFHSRFITNLRRTGFYSRNDPRIGQVLEHGHIPGVDTVFFDVETIVGGPRNRAYSFAFGRHGAGQKGFAKFNHVLMPLELLYSEDILHNINSAFGKSTSSRQRVIESQDFLLKRFSDDFIAMQNKIGIGKAESEQMLGKVIDQYKASWTKSGITGTDILEASERFLEDLKVTGLHPKAKIGNTQLFLGWNSTTFDIPHIDAALSTTVEALSSFTNKPRDRYQIIRANELKKVALDMRKNLAGVTPLDVSILATTPEWYSNIRGEISAGAAGGRLTFLKTMVSKRRYKNVEAAKILGIEITGSLHEAMTDAQLTERIYRKLTSLSPFDKYTNATASEWIKAETNAGYRYDIEARKTFAKRATRQVSDAGGAAYLGRGRLAGLSVSGITHTEGGNYVLDIASRVKEPIGFNFEPAEKLISLMEKATGKDKAMLDMAISSGYLNDPVKAETLLKLYAHNTDAGLKKLLVTSGFNPNMDKKYKGGSYSAALEEQLSKTGKGKTGILYSLGNTPLAKMLGFSDTGYMAPGARMKSMKRSYQGFISPSRKTKGPIEDAIFIADRAVETFMAKVARESVHFTGVTSEREAARMIDRFMGGVEPLDRLAGSLQSEIKQALNLSSTERSLVGNIDAALSKNIYADFLTQFMEGIPTEMSGLTSIMTRVNRAKFGHEVNFVKRNRFEAQKRFLGETTTISDAIRDSIKELPVERQAEIMNLVDDLYTDNVHGMRTLGYAARSHIFSRTVQKALVSAFPNMGIETLEEASSLGYSNISRVRESINSFIGGLIKGGAEEASRFGIAGEYTQGGLWSLANSLRKLDDKAIEGLKLAGEEREFVDILRTYQNSNIPTDRLDISSEGLERVAARVSRATGAIINPENIYKQIELQSTLNWDQIIHIDKDVEATLGSITPGGDDVANEVADRLFRQSERQILKRAWGTNVSNLIKAQKGETTGWGLDYYIRDALGYNRKLLEDEKDYLNKIYTFAHYYLKDVTGTGPSHHMALISANDEVKAAAETLIAANETMRYSGPKTPKYKSAFKERVEAERTISQYIVNEMFSPGSKNRIDNPISLIRPTAAGGVRQTTLLELSKGISEINRRIKEAFPSISGRGVASQPINATFHFTDAAESIKSASSRLTGVLPVTGIRGDIFGDDITGTVDAVSIRMQGIGYLGDNDEILTNGRLLVHTETGRAVPIGVDREGSNVLARAIAARDVDVGFEPGSTPVFRNIESISMEGIDSGSGIKYTHKSPLRIISIQNALQRGGYVEREAKRAAEQIREAEKAAEENIHSRIISQVSDSGASSALRNTRSELKSLGEVMTKASSHWKIIAAGVAGAAALTMLRKERPLMPQDSMTYGYGPNGMSYPMGYANIAPVSTYLGSPPSQGMRASISGVMPSDIDVSTIRDLVGGMGIANIHINDNTKTITPSEIDKMISDRLA